VRVDDPGPDRKDDRYDLGLGRPWRNVDAVIVLLFQFLMDALGLRLQQVAQPLDVPVIDKVVLGVGYFKGLFEELVKGGFKEAAF